MFIKPMLAAVTPDSKKPKITYENGYHLEAKHDGMRAIISKVDNEIKVYSRAGKEYAANVPHLVEQLSYLPDNTILDGELMVSSKTVEYPNGVVVPVPDFNMTMRIMGSDPEVSVEKQSQIKVNFYVFDILMYDGEDVQDKTYLERQEIMRSAVVPSDNVMVSDPWGEWDEDDLKKLMDAGIEGAILKNKDSKYIAGKRRSNTWYKIKVTETADVVVVGFTDANEGKTGKWLGKIGAIRYGVYDNGELKEIGQCSGMTDAERDRWTSLRDSDSYHGRVIEIKYNDLVGGGTPRHPQYITERLDKSPTECTIDQFKE